VTLLHSLQGLRFALVLNLLVCKTQICCDSRLQAASKGHYECFIHLVPDLAHPQGWDVYPCVTLILREGNIRFARRLFSEYPATASYFAEKCIEEHDTLALEVARLAAPDMHLHEPV
jgi:hypothetical protein